MDADEKFVRDNWEDVGISEGACVVVVFCRIPSVNDCQDLRGLGSGNTLPEALSNAAEFTRECLKQIADVEEEIRILNQVEFPKSFYSVNSPKDRILAREQRSIAELRKGMKEQG